MIVNTTHSSQSNTELINDLVGKPFSFLQILKLRGIGSKRMIIDDVSPNLKTYLNKVADISYANIELRPGGILIMINKGHQNFTWAIPYYQLVIFKANGSSIHAQGKFIHFMKNRFFKENKAFFSKLNDQKIKYDLNYPSPTMY